MRNKETNETDEPLHNLLQEWKVTASLPPRLEEQVWRRIADAESEDKRPGWMGLFHWLQMSGSGRALAASYLAVLLLAGLLTGYWQAQSKVAQMDAALSQRYVQSIDPYRKE